MQKQIPFKKDISFDTMLTEINSISLEHIVDKKSDNQITGKFIISGDYKMISSSNVLDKFEYKLPFNINVDKKYDIEESVVDISDFYYEIINNKILEVNIELTVDNIKEIMLEEESEEDNNDCLKEVDEEEIREDKEENDTSIKTINSIFGNLNDNESYVTYKVHIITENDTIDSLCTVYNVSREQLTCYNNLDDIKIGTKIIIPANENK